MYYYATNTNIIFDNRYEAIKYYTSTNNLVSFYFKDDQFSKVNWKIEPSESLEQLYKERAQFIRDNYEYVVLCFSGGIDSTNMLESFYYNGIHIDEIVSVGSFSQDKTKEIDINHNKEIYDNVIPLLNSFNLPNTKKTLIDYTDYFRDLNNFSLYTKYGADYYKYIGVYPSVTYLFWYDIGKFINPKGKTAILLAAEKPYVRYDSELNSYFTHFDDASTFNYCDYEFNNVFRINFYTDPLAEKLLRKQVHIIKNYYIAQNNFEKIEKELKIPKLYRKDYLSTITDLIYNVKNPLKYVAGKSSNQFLSCRDTYLTDNKNSDVYKLYISMLEKLKLDVDIKRLKYTFATNRYYIT